MIRGRYFIALVTILIICTIADAENLRKRKKDRSKPLNFDQSNNGKLFSALTINYPLQIFNLDSGTKDWRLPGEYSSEFAEQSTAEKGYVDISRAQDQEDVWLYENWFYGIKDGVIIESGALDGILFSTSFMFEVFANWTAVHVGKNFDTLYAHI